MEPHELAIAAKYVGAGLAAIGTGAAGIGVGTLFGQFLDGPAQPVGGPRPLRRLIFGFAVTKALGIFALLIAFLSLFAVWRALFGSLYERALGVTTKDLTGASADHSDATQTQVGQEEGAHSNFPPFDPGTFPSQLVWFAIAFGFLYWYLSERAYHNSEP